MSTNDSITHEIRLDKETKNTYVYAPAAPGPVKTLYVDKLYYSTGAPATLTVKLTEGDAE